MYEYLNQPEETSETIKTYKGALWFLTVDIGFMDEDGTIEIRDRKKQLIKVAGHSVFPKEVESMLMKHEAVSENLNTSVRLLKRNCLLGRKKT